MKYRIDPLKGFRQIQVHSHQVDNFHNWERAAFRDAGVVDLIIEPIFKTFKQDPLRPCIQPTC